MSEPVECVSSTATNFRVLPAPSHKGHAPARNFASTSVFESAFPFRLA